jgi:type IV pilus assembly protein PilO
MNDILENFSSLKTVQKVAIVVVIAGLVSAVNYFLFFSPLEDEYMNLLNRRSSLEEKKLEYDDKSKTLEMDKAINRKIDEKLIEEQEKLPNRTETDIVIHALGIMADSTLVRINNIEPQKEVIKDLYVEKPIKLEINGSFHEILNFLNKVGEANRIINMNDIKMSNPTYKNQKVLIDAELTIKIYRFKREGEGKKGKKKKKKKRK